MTPQQFAAAYVDLPIDDYVCLVHDPRPTSPHGQTFTVEYLGNVVEGGIVKYLNVDVALMKELASEAILGGEPVWFGCDIGKMSTRDLGIWDKDPLRLRLALRHELTLDKAARLLPPRPDDDPRDALHRSRRGRRRPAALAGREQLGR